MKGVEDIAFDGASERLTLLAMSTCRYTCRTRRIITNFLGKVPTGPLARTALRAPQLNRYFVAAPQHRTTNAEIVVFEVH